MSHAIVSTMAIFTGVDTDTADSTAWSSPTYISWLTPRAAGLWLTTLISTAILPRMCMTQRQAIAIGQPCATPAETLSSAFYRGITVGSTVMSTILTVNK